MLYTVMKYLIPFAALLGIGPVALHFTHSLRALDGGHNVSLLVGASPSSGAIAALIVLALATLTGCLGARLVGKRMGLFSAGLVLAWACWGTGQMDRILTQPHAEGALRTLALEGVFIGILGAFASALILWTPVMRSALPETRDPAGQHRHLPQESLELWDSTVPMAIGATALAAAVVVWIIAQETLKGQTVAAAILAGAFGAAAGRLASQRACAIWFFVAIGILAAASPIVASFMYSGSSGVLRAALTGHLFALARPLPLDWIAGAFLGIPLGLTWSESLVEQHSPARAHAR